MDRIPESELMLDIDNVKAYAEADFEAPHTMFINLFQEKFKNINLCGDVLDLGCGSCDISIRFAEKYNQCIVHGIDSSENMLKYGMLAIQSKGLENRINLYHQYLPNDNLPIKSFSVIISNSLLHHLLNPYTLWKTLKKYSNNETLVFIMDLHRPENRINAQNIVNKYCQGEPDILKRDFYNSLLASYTLDEIKIQLEKENLSHLSLEIVSDRHYIIYGRVKSL